MKNIIERIAGGWAKIARYLPKAVSTRLAVAALAALAAGGAWAGFKMTNPVTGKEETYTYKFVGTTHIWNGTQYWQNSEGANPSAVPGVTNSNLWDPILFDASVNSINITAGLSVEGWNLRMGLYKGANVKLNNLQKLQGNNTPMWITVDGTSQCTIGHMANAKLVNSSPLSLYSAKMGGIAWSEALSDSSNGDGSSMPFHYYLTGTGSVAFNAGISVTGNGAHVIKQADVTLTGTSQVSSKTLVSFTSSTKTFTADAAIKVYDTDGTTLKKLVGVTAVRQSGATIANTSSVLTTADDAVGTCEIVQCTDGIVLYYVDGAPSAVTGYTPSININFTNGNGLTTAGEVGLSGYAVPGMSWNNFTILNDNTERTFSTVASIDSTGVASTASGVSVTVSGHRGVHQCSSLDAGSNPLHGYVDEGGATGSNTATPTVTITGIPYANYRLIVYHSTDSDNLPFGYDTINGTDFTYVDGVQAIGTTSWGNSGASNSANAIAEGVNTLVSGILSGSTATMVAHRVGTANSASVRGCFAAIQVVEVVVSDTELVIPVTGATTYTVDADKEYEKVIISGTGTLTLDGTGTITTDVLEIENNSAIVMNSSRLAATTVIGKGTAIYDVEVPPTDKGWTDSDNWTGTVWIKNYGTGGDTTRVGVIGTDSGNADNNVMNNWGNANSFVKFTNVRGWCDTGTLAWTLILEDDGTNYAWYNNNGYSGRKTTFGALKGTGTFYDVGNTGCRQLITFTEASGFTGVFHVTGKRIGLGGDNTAANNGTEGSGTIEIVSTASATIASGKTWTTGVGFRIKGTLAYSTDNAITNAVTGSGTLVRTGITNHGNVTAPTALGLTDSTKWTGVFEFRDCNMGVWSAKNFGNAESTVRLNGTTSYFQTKPDDAPHAVKCIDIGSSGWTVDGNYSSGAFYVPAKLTGSGTFTVNTGGSGNRNFYFTGDASEFAGVIVVTGTNNRVVVGSTSTERTFASGSLVVADGGVLTVSSSTQWNPVGGLFVDEGGVITLNGGALWTTAGITVDGTLKATGRGKWGGGTPMVINDTGILELTSTSSVDESNSNTYNYGNVTGTGTIKFNGTGYRGFPYTSPADTLSIVAEQTEGIVFRQDNKVIGSLSGTKNLRSDLGGYNKTLTIKQAKDGVWSGIFKGGDDRLATIVVAPGDSTTGTLTLAGTQDQANWTDALTVDGSVNLTGTWQGPVTVSGMFGGTGTLTGALTFNAGSTFKAFASDENGLAVSGTVTCPAEGKVTVDVSALKQTGTKVLMTASGLDDSTFALASGQSGKLSVDGNALKVSFSTYVASYGGKDYETIQEAIDAAVADNHTYEEVTILDPNATCPAGYYVDTENNNILAMCQAAIVKTDSSKVYFKTAQLAFDDIDEHILGNVIYDYFEVYTGAGVVVTVNPAKTAWSVLSVKVKCLNDATVDVTLASTEYELNEGDADANGIVTYTKSEKPTTYVWTGNTDNVWNKRANWAVGTASGATASRSPSSVDTAAVNGSASITVTTVSVAGLQVSGAVTFTGVQASITSASPITLGANDTISLTDVTLSPTPTTTVANSYVKLTGSTYSVATVQNASISDVTFEYYASYTNADVTATVGGAGTYTLTVQGKDYVADAGSAGTVTFENVDVSNTELGSGVAYTITATGAATGGTSGTSDQKKGTVVDGSGWMLYNKTATGVGSWTDGDGAAVTPVYGDNDYASFSGTNIYAATGVSTGDVVTVSTVVAFGGAANPAAAVDPEAQAALRINAGESGNTFQVYTAGPAWVDVGNNGLGAPEDEQRYTVGLRIDYGVQKFYVTIGKDETVYSLTNAAGVSGFDLAKGASGMRQVQYNGSGSFVSIEGANLLTGYMADVGTEGNVTNVAVSADFVSEYLAGEKASAVQALISPTAERTCDNGLNYFESYALGLNPTSKNDAPIVNAAPTSEGKIELSLTKANGDAITPAGNVDVDVAIKEGSNDVSGQTSGEGAGKTIVIDPASLGTGVHRFKAEIGIGAK